MTFISGTSGATSSGQSSNSLNPIQQLASSNSFLQLLVAQLKYQNPLNPVSGTQFISQTAQLSEVEMVQQMSTEMAAEQAAVQTSTATSLIGKTVTANLSSGKTLTGTVSSVELSSTGVPTLTVSGTAVALSAVTKVT
ncbi:MAG: flagellar hook capping FlgD N-terminal domain-containing protein [Acidimicrobiales bacterium]